MCGRFTLRANLNRILAEFGADARSELTWHANADIRPTTPVLAIRSIDGKRELSAMRWGLVPPWEPEFKTKFATFNARSDTVAEKPTYRSPFKHKRCLIVADGYDEWKVVGGTKSKPVKQRYHMHFPDDGLFAFAGLWESHKLGESCTIIVTDAAPALTEIHDRMPVILHKEDYDLWLDPDFEGKDKLLSLLQPYDGELVSTAV